MIKEVQDLAPFLQQYPGWVKIAFAVWVFFTASVCVVLLLCRPQQPRSQERQPNQVVTNKPTAAIEVPQETTKEVVTISLTVAEYFSTLSKLDGRFFDLDEFIKSVSGKRVNWKGRVSSVSASDRSCYVTLDREGKSDRGSFSAIFSRDFGEKLYALRKGDRVCVSGILQAQCSPCPDVIADALERLDT